MQPNSKCSIHRTAARYRSIRRGSAYVMVLGTTLIVAAIGTGGLLVVRAQTRNIDSYTRTAAAREYALSAIELGIQEIASNSKWRTTHKNDVDGVWYNAKSIGSGTYSLKVVNPNGALDRDPVDPVNFTATGTVNNGIERQMVQVTVVPQIIPLTCLQTAMTAGGVITFGASKIQAMNNTVASNSVITASGPIYARLEAVGTVTSSQNYDGAPTSLATARTMPDPATVFDWYKANGTVIDINAIPLRTISNVLISPAVNPYGALTNAQGIYVIDCQGQSLTIKASRIVGTLVVLNPLSGASETQTQLNWEPAVANFPCLLVQGDFNFKTNSTALSESSVNFNPPSTPYPYFGGTSNATAKDSYPTSINGLVYMSGNGSSNSSVIIDMIMTGGSYSSSSSLTMNNNPVYYSNPPPGFYTPKMIPSPGTWNQLTY